MMNIHSIKNKLTAKGSWKIYLSFMLLAIAFAFLFKLDIKIPGTDDYVFPQQVAPYHTVFSWVSHRYHTWSGRIFTEAFFYLVIPKPLFIWKIISFLLLVAQVVFFYLYYKLFSSHRDIIKDRLMVIVCCVALLLMNSIAFFDGVLWPTGGVAYLWMGALGTIGLYPVAFYLKHKSSPHWAFTVAGSISAVVASCSQEQVGALLCGLSLLGLGYIFIVERFKPFPWVPAIITALSTVAFLVSIKAPGNVVRYKAEVATWLPSFLHVSVLHRAEYSYRWILDAVVNHTGFLLVGIWIMLCILLLRKVHKDKWDYITIGFLGIASLLSTLKGYDQVNYFFNFYNTWGQAIPTPLGKIILLPWLLVLVASCVAPIVLFRKTPLGLLIAGLLCAFYASVAMMVFSPTMYASGWRTLYIPALVLIFVFLFLTSFIMDAYKKQRLYIFLVMLILAVSQYIFLIQKLFLDVSLT